MSKKSTIALKTAMLLAEQGSDVMLVKSTYSFQVTKQIDPTYNEQAPLCFCCDMKAERTVNVTEHGSKKVTVYHSCKAHLVPLQSNFT